MTKRGNEAGEALKRLQQQHEQTGSSAQVQSIDLGAGDAAQQQSLLGVTPPIIGHGRNSQQGASSSRSVQQFFVAVSGTSGQTVAVQNPQLGPRQQLLGSPLVVVPPSGQRSGQLTPLVLTQDSINDFQIIGSTAQVPNQFLTPVTSTTSAVSRAGATARGTVHHLGQGQLPAVITPATPTGVPRTQAPSESQIRGLITQLQAQSSQMVQLQQAARQASITPPLPTQPTITQSPLQSPDRPRKKMKTEDIPAASEEIAKTRAYICNERLKQMSHIKECYTEHLTELFFLQSGGNMMDYFSWKKRATPQLQFFLQTGKLDSDEEEVESQEKSINNEVKILTASGSATPVATPVAISTTLPPAVQSIQLQQPVNARGRRVLLPGVAVERKAGGRHGMVFGHVQPQNTSTLPPPLPGGIPLNTTAATTTVGSPPPYMAPNTSTPPTTINITTASSATVMTTTVSTAVSSSISSTLARMMAEGKSVSTPLRVNTSTVSTVSSVLSPSVKSQLTPGSQATKPHSISAVYDSTIGSQEAIVERAKQEAQVMQRVAELRKSGLWTARRLPKVQEPPRHKAHWDYLLEEMQWLAADFAQERKWKKAGSRKIARMITKYHQEQQQKELKAEKEESQRLVRIAGNMAKMVKEFWSNIEKVVQYKQQSRLEEKRKKALDLHLSFIVDQTEKYSSWLTEGLAQSGPGSVVSASIGSPKSSLAGDDGDFEPVKDESDDEETIEKAEEGLDEESTKKEIEELQAESEMPLEDLLKSLPKEVLENPASLECGESGEESDVHRAKKRKNSDDDSFHSDAEDSDDVEETINEEEKEEEEVDHKVEIDDLQKESEMSMEDLYAKYAGAYDSDFEAELSPESGGETDIDDEETEEEGTASEESSGEEEADSQEEVGVEALMEEEPQAAEPQADKSKLGPNEEISDIAAAAESIQPTGYTLETTQVQTTVPFLLKHTLREYQHVGLDWLATMYIRKLNGILADEMGLGKTIQTIALLAHMACEHGVWGPHLIVVPTSVMLNWEMEFKKWCPAFKILTYYGNQKERKLKRQGWTKTNAFHVCITSYKLVIQDHQSFRRKKWKYFILDEAQNIKNFKSQRWQTLLNFISQRRLLLTGTPLQNSLMELWSLMHFLMPHVFQSHREFKEWFANPLSGMIEGSREYNENLIKRLHKVLRPFLLRRLKADVEKQMPKKYEHVVMCRLSKRQRYLYDDFMAQSKTKETLATGHFMSVINILMQLRKVCNHPNLFDPRPIISPFQMEGISYTTASIVLRALEKDPLEYIDPCSIYPNVAEMELKLPAYGAHRACTLSTSRKLIEEIDSTPDPPPRPKVADKPTKFVFRSLSPLQPASGRSSPFVPIQQRAASPLTSKPQLGSSVVTPTPRLSSGALTSVTPSPLQGSLPAVSVMGSTAQVIAAPVAATVPTVASVPASTSQIPSSILQAKVIPQPQVSGVSLVSTPGSQQVLTSQPITVQIHHTQQGTRLMIPSGQLSQLPGFIQIVQTSTGQQIIATSQPPSSGSGQRVQTFINGPGLATPISTLALSLQSPSVSTPTAASTPTTTPTATSQGSRPATTVQLPTSSGVASGGKPVVRVSPMASVSSAPNTDVTSIQVAGQPVRTTSTSSTMATAGPTQTMVATATKTMVASRTTTVKSEPKAEKAKEKAKSVFYLRGLEERRKRYRKEKLSRLATINARNCSASPVYGTDLTQLAGTMTDLTHMSDKALAIACRGLGYVHCQSIHGSSTSPNRPEIYWKQTNSLSCSVRTPRDYLTQMKELLERFVFNTPPVRAPRIRMHTGHPPPSLLQADRRLEYTLHKEVSPLAAPLHPVSTRMEVQFPELRLIQYDCGKLQTMDILLRQLKTGGHRVLVFTQMTRMLDILESFLNYHGHRYLRLDGTTKVEQRQALMDRFNMDKRIFVFILSTRSGGIGVNLTGADTVIFYDSDWNPTMDAQAQDRCHRIGQTRDVHIYRLVSEKTVEENILKKANQKRLLGNVAIEGGNFTTAFFRENTIKDLFEEPSGLDALAAEKIKQEEAEQSRQREARSKAAAEAEAAKSAALLQVQAIKEEEEAKLTQEQIEQALCAAEEESDIMAAKVVKAEQKAELAEFDESIPWDEREEHLKRERDDEISRVEHELLLLEKELTPVERMAVRFVEAQMAPFTSEELQKAEEEVTIAKEEWELGRLKSLKEEEERRAELEEDEMLFTYSRDDAINQVFINDESGEHMPMWSPPTPPQDDNDLYIDSTLCFLYEPSVMPESQLPPVYVKKEHKRIRVDHTVAVRKHKVRNKEDQPRVPPSLFNRPRDGKIRQGLIKPFKQQSLASRPSLDGGVEQPEWLIHEDWALLQAFQMLQELPLNLATKSPAHIANWDLIADVVNGCSRTYRSPKQCKNRYENVIVPREEGKILYDINPRNKKKSKGIYKTKNNRPMRSSQLYIQDNNNSVTTLFTLRFDACKSSASKRTPTLRPTLANPTMKNPKHAAVLLESGIKYELPLTPIRVAANRADRIALEKKKQQTQQAAAQLQEQQLAAQRAVAQTVQAAQTTQQIATPAAAGTAVTPQTGMTIVQGTSLPVVTATGTTLVPQATKAGGTVSAVSLTRSFGATGSIVVNAAGGVAAGNTFATINKRINPAVVCTVASVAHTVPSTATSTMAVRAARANPTQMTVQEITAAVVNQGQTRVVTTSAHVLPSQAQLIAAQKAGAVTVASVAGGTVQHQLATTKTLTQQQLQLLRHQALMKQQQRLKMVSQGATVAGALQKTVTATPLITSVAQSSQLAQAARLQAPKQTVKQTVTRQMTEQELAVLMKQQIQHQRLSAASRGTVQQIQVTQGVTRLTSAQLLSAQVQMGGQATVSSSQPMATLVKTVSTPGSTGPSVTIPLSAVSLGISMPQQQKTKTLTPAQITRQLQLQQHQKRLAQQQQQKIVGQIQQVAKAQGSQPLIIPQGQTLPKVMVQQFLKQQIITSVAPTVSTTAGAVIATQLVTTAQPMQTVTKMTVPSASVSSSALGQGRAGVPMTVTAMPVQPNPSLVAGTAGVTHAIVSGATTMAVPSQTTLVSPQKGLSLTPGVLQQMKSVGGIRQLPGGVTVAQLQGAQGMGQPTHTVSIHPTSVVTPPKPQISGVQHAVQQVVQQAQAQAQLQRQVVSAVPGSLATTVPPPITVSINQPSQQSVTVALQPAGSSVVQSTVPHTLIQHLPTGPAGPAQQAGVAGQQPPGQQGVDAQGKTSPFSMRLRNQKQ